jgi:tungstate transport system substrate-binding protein
MAALPPPGLFMPRAFSLPRAAGLAAFGFALVLAAAPASARTVRLATPASTEQAGLLAQLLPKFKQGSGLDVQVVTATAAQAAEQARRGEVDVLLLDDKDKLPAHPMLGKPVPVMSNQFLLVGPKADPAGARGKEIVEALRKVDTTRSLFISRGDQGIVHATEQRLWLLAGIKGRKGGGHRECRCGMGGTLDIAAMAYGYALADKGTWTAFRNRAELDTLVEADPRLTLTYFVIPVNIDRQLAGKTDAQKAELLHRARDAQAFARWLAGPEAQALIAAHKVGAQQFFFARAAK